MGDYEYELFFIDDVWCKNIIDVVVVQLCDVGIKVKWIVLSGFIFWNDWVKYLFFFINWNYCFFGVQIWGLVYCFGEVWNEFGWFNVEFDGIFVEVLVIVDVEVCCVLMVKGEEIICEEGVIIQLYWCLFYNYMKEGLEGVGYYIIFEFCLVQVYWI